MLWEVKKETRSGKSLDKDKMSTFHELTTRVAHSDFCVTTQKYICAVIDVERACVKGETLILNIDKVSDVSAMIDHTLSLAIHISCTIHNLGVRHSHRIS